MDIANFLELDCWIIQLYLALTLHEHVYCCHIAVYNGCINLYPYPLYISTHFLMYYPISLSFSVFVMDTNMWELSCWSFDWHFPETFWGSPFQQSIGQIWKFVFLHRAVTILCADIISISLSLILFLVCTSSSQIVKLKFL